MISRLSRSTKTSGQIPGFTSVVSWFGEGAPSSRLAYPHRAFEVDRDELRYAAFGHGDAEQAVHARHGDRVVGDDDEARVGELGHLVEQVAEAFDVVVVERCVDLVEHADGRRVGE